MYRLGDFNFGDLLILKNNEPVIFHSYCKYFISESCFWIRVIKEDSDKLVYLPSIAIKEWDKTLVKERVEFLRKRELEEEEIKNEKWFG